MKKTTHKGIHIGDVIKKAHTGLANYAGRLFGKLSGRTQKMFFVLTFSIAGTYCLILLFGGGSGGIPHAGKIQPPILPARVKYDSMGFKVRERVIGLRAYLDSLSLTTDGRKERDSILAKNPGLSDSLRHWEKRLEQYENK